MKALYSTMILSCALFASCTNDDVVNESALAGGQEVKVTASLTNSRTYYEQGEGVVKTFWNANDAIGLSTANQSNLKYTADAAGATTTFTKADAALTGSDGTDVFAYYPYKEGENNVPKTYVQRYVGDNIPYQDFLWSEGKVQNGTLTLSNFKHLFGFIKLTIEKGALTESTTTADGEVYQLSINSNANLCLADDKGGVFGSDQTLTNYYPWTGILYWIPANTFDDKDEIICYIAILPVAEGHTITITSGNSTLLSKTAPTGGGFEAGKVYSTRINAPEAPEDDENGVAGEYDVTYNDMNGNAHTTTTTLVKKDETTYLMQGLPNRGDYSMILTYSKDDKSLTMKAGQLIESWGNGIYLYFFMKGFHQNNGLIYQAEGWNYYFGNTTDLTYVGTYSDEDGNPKYTFADGETWNSDRKVDGFGAAITYWDGSGSWLYISADDSGNQCFALDFVMTKK